MTRRRGRLRLGPWRSTGEAALEPHLEAGSLRVGDRLYVLGGYQALTRMGTRMQILDIPTSVWRYGPPLPSGCPLSHAGVASDGRFLFVVSGQPGPACEPATERAWALDLADMAWTRIRSLPVARYAPLLEYVDGQLHLISGAAADRETVSTEHFVLRLRDGTAEAPRALPSLESQAWRRGPSIPLGGDHAASVVLGRSIYVIGGEHGHARVTMDASKCCGTYSAHPYLFRYDVEREEWRRLADLPFAVSHIESQVLALDGRILVLGGSGPGDVFSDRVQEYDPARDRWRELAPLPQPRKGGVAWHAGGAVYLNGGQITLDGREQPVVGDTIGGPLARSAWFSPLGLAVALRRCRGAVDPARRGSRPPAG